MQQEFVRRRFVEGNEHLAEVETGVGSDVDPVVAHSPAERVEVLGSLFELPSLEAELKEFAKKEELQQIAEKILQTLREAPLEELVEVAEDVEILLSLRKRV